MALRAFLGDRSKRQGYAHYLAGLIVLIHAYENYDGGEHPWLLFAATGIIILAVAIFHHPLQAKIPGINGIFFVIEGTLSMIIAVDLYGLGKKALPI